MSAMFDETSDSEAATPAIFYYIFVLIPPACLGSHLCGYNTGYHVYLEMGAVGASPGSRAAIAIKLDTANWAAYSRRWSILASQIECDRDYHAPQVSNRADNDPSVFTITEKAPTRAFSWLRLLPLSHL